MALWSLPWASSCTQDRLLKRGGSAWDWTWGLPAGGLRAEPHGLFLGVALRFPLEASLAGALAWALLPALYGVAAGLRPLPLGRPARLYAQAVGDALGPTALLAPVALLYAVPLGLALAALGLLALLGGHLGED